MKQQDPEQLLSSFQAGECTPEELALVEAYINYEGITNQDLLEIEADLIEYKNKGYLIPTKYKIIGWPFKILFIAAAVAVVASFWAVLFTNPSNLPTSYSSDVNPGGNKALLTLENGKKIQLNDSKTGVVIDATKLSYNDGTIINNERPGRIKITTPKGGTYQVRLPDGSTVWLNSASSLTYNKSSINGVEARRVNLTGEAYFEVSKNKQLPFIVTTRKQVVTVLGTHFNISSYENQAADKTTLLEGSVRVELIADSGKLMSARTEILKPGEQAITLGSQIQVAHPDPKIASSWKDGEFAFRNESLEDILNDVSRWYDIEVVYEDPGLKKRLFGGMMSKHEKVSKVLQMLELAAEDVKFDIQGKKIIVAKK
ncbi:FecR family protein [Pedobacter nyackensis]|uniref:FecR family protein n=1 Tax=Pedobacter nyackensis TaxID=475255 RepID=UPI002930340C|nr:FecR domain-containing protein [Pedobacter nyackensis]